MGFVLVGNPQYSLVLLRLCSRTGQNAIMMVINLKWSLCPLYLKCLSAFTICRSILLCIDKISLDRTRVWSKLSALVITSRFWYIVSLKYGMVTVLGNLDVNYCEDGSRYKLELTSILNTWIVSNVLNIHTNTKIRGREKEDH